MYDYKILKTEIKHKYQMTNRTLVSVSLPLLSLRSKYLQNTIDSYMDDLITNNFILLLSSYNPNKDIYELLTFMESEIIYNIALSNELDTLLVVEEVGDNIMDFLQILLNIVTNIHNTYSITNMFSMLDKNFNTLLDNWGYLENIHEISFWNNTYIVLDEYIIK